ncbi:MAG: trk/ktr system potassium uptake protein [Pseudonocardiales bacterium]|jgi:trk system potassium uptake protein TrkA|nr:potassium transporter TrkA [Pseudonocardiales bacterium]MDT4909168.1 trk/ktr system potassium uptake protein [Pseudonocardiales bacterium]MDT4963568.1 trk/ktr system potassium uptake protein [Pseudonocardiales bacterium]MDT4973176.1 trk/ktr system potassium uptake protein [Pseudonocardiales bacterium]MDT4979633.1 trk/ktr system potassium uptake protein [Pseudonocardiales bacterium]
MRIAIAGAGAVGRSIAQRLLDAGNKVLLIERERAHYRPELVPDADWMFADASDLGTLRTAGIHMCDVVIGAAGDDRANLVFALLCKTEFAVSRVVARINNPANQWLFTESWGVDVAVSTPNALVIAVDTAVAIGDIVKLTTTQGSAGNIVEITLPAASGLVGTSLADLTLPADCAVVSVLRDGQLVTPHPNLTFDAGDGIVLVATAAAESDIRTLVRRNRPTG